MWNVSSSLADLLFVAFNITLIIGTVAVLIGTIGAYVVSGVREQFSNERIATAEAQSEVAKEGAALANLELAKYRAPRIISDDYQAALLALLKPLAGQGYAISVAAGQESEDLMCSVDNILGRSGWVKHELVSASDMVLKVNTKCGPVAVNGLSGFAIRVSLTAPKETSDNADVLGKALITAGIAVQAGRDTQNIPIPTVILLMIGTKH